MCTQGGWDALGDWHCISTLPCIKQIVGTNCKKFSSALCSDLDGWDGGAGGRDIQEGRGNVYIQMIHFITQHKLTT